MMMMMMRQSVAPLLKGMQGSIREVVKVSLYIKGDQGLTMMRMVSDIWKSRHQRGDCIFGLQVW